MVEIVYGGLQSCLVSNPVDIPFNEPNAKPHCEESSYKTNTVHHSNPDNNQSGWNLVEALSNVSNVSKDKERSSKSYNYAVGTSSVRLSPKSLELCTENLGNETGSDEMMESEVELFSYSSWEKGEKKKGSGMIGGEKEKRREIPPPLSTIRGGSYCLRMMAHREDGRLVIQVTKLQPTASCFRAERNHGRLRLSFLRNPMEEEEQEEEEEEQEEEEANEEAELEGDGDDENERETSGNSWNIGGGIAIMQKYDTKGPTRCKQGGFGIAVLNFLTA